MSFVCSLLLRILRHGRAVVTVAATMPARIVEYFRELY